MAYQGIDAVWLRWFTPGGAMLLTEAEAAQQRAEAAQQRAEAAQQRAEAAGGTVATVGRGPGLGKRCLAPFARRVAFSKNKSIIQSVY